MDIERKMEEYLKPLFGDMASLTIKMQKDKLNVSSEMGKEEYEKVIDSIHHLCAEMAGEGLGRKIKQGLLEILEEEYAKS